MSVDNAFLQIRKELKIDPGQDNFSVSREITSQGKVSTPNIVIILLESMAMNYLDYEGEDGKLMPFLNELISKSYFFENCYSAGVHTNNAVVSTLYGFPALFNKPSMKYEMRYTGLPTRLREQGYQNLFFITGNPNYDHMNLFLLESGFDRIYSLYDYPEEKIVNNFGIQDDYLLEYGLERLNEAAQNKKPFLAAFLTVSNHSPYIIPPKYQNITGSNDRKIVRFVDDALKTFMENASKQEWFKNTIFVFLGDHGAVLGQPKYEIPIEKAHIPLIIYSQMFEHTPKRFDSLCGQIDVFPTLLGMTNMPYTNNSLGIDLLKEQRPCAYFVSDNLLGCVNKKHLYVRNVIANTDLLYDLRDAARKNIMQQENTIGQAMKTYSLSMMVAADYLIKNKKTGK